MNREFKSAESAPLTVQGTPGLAHPPQLERLNREHGFPLRRSSAHSLLGRVRRRLAELFLGEYACDHARFQLDLVQYLNGLHERVARIELHVSDELRWSVGSLERKLRESFEGEIHGLRRGLEELQSAVAADRAHIDTIDSVARGIERIVASTSSLGSPPVPSTSGADGVNRLEKVAGGPAASTDYSYLLLENRFRGSEEEIRQRLASYVGIFREGTIAGMQLASVSGPVLEIGAGRGELQLLLGEHGVRSYGVDLDRAMVERCRVLGLDVREENGIEHLRALPDRSLGGVIAVQVVEHLPIAVLRELLALCNRKVELGGRIVFETINTASMVALAHNYFRDPTHEWPLHPETMRYLVELSGAEVMEVQLRSPYPSGAVLQEIALPEFMTPRWSDTIGTINHNIRELNRLLFGHQDYSIVARAL